MLLWGDRTRKRPGEFAPVIRRNGQEIEMVELVWGLRPRNAEDGPIINIRSEGRTFPTHRCLVPAIDFFFRDQSEARRRWRFTLADGDSFYLAGIWRQASDDWPEAYAVLTTASNPDVAPVNDRQMVVIPDWTGWTGWHPRKNCSALSQPAPSGASSFADSAMRPHSVHAATPSLCAGQVQVQVRMTTR
jgi:putative SOS response-associated peptidase YedK